MCGFVCVCVLFSQRWGIYLKNPFGAGDSPRQSALLFFSSISSAAAATSPVGRVAGQWQAPLTGNTDVLEETEDSSRETGDFQRDGMETFHLSLTAKPQDPLSPVSGVAF